MAPIPNTRDLSVIALLLLIFSPAVAFSHSSTSKAAKDNGGDPEPKIRYGEWEDSFSNEGKTGSFAAIVAKDFSPKNHPGLMIFLHGAGGRDGYKLYLQDLSALAKKHNLIPISVQTPNGAMTWPNRDIRNDNQHTSYLINLIDKRLIKPYNIDKTRLVFVGLSAGSTFLVGDLLPAIKDRYQGAMILLCGGGPPFMVNAPLARGLNSSFKLYFRIDTGDFLYAQTKAAMQLYDSLGYQVTTEIGSASGHCSFNVKQEIEKGLGVFTR